MSNTSRPNQQQLLLGAAIGSSINFFINGVINYFMMRSKDVHTITTDSITAGSDTVLGHGVTTAAILAVVFTLVAFNSQKKNLPGIAWGQVGWIAVKNAVYAFGVMIIVGVFWQRLFPNRTVGTIGAAAISGLIACVVSGIVNYSTLSTLFQRTGGLARSISASTAAGVVLLLLCLNPSQASGQSTAPSPASDQPKPGVIRPPVSLAESEGRPIASVFYNLIGAAGITGGDARARNSVEESASIDAGSLFYRPVVDLAIQRIRTLPFVANADYQLYESDRAGYVVLVLNVEFGSAATRSAKDSPFPNFPVLFQDEKTLIRLNLDGGFGAYSDFNPWFGSTDTFANSPIATSPARGSNATWGEASVEYGLSAIRQVGQSPLWAFASGSVLTDASIGQDLFRDDERNMTELEDLYGGVVFGSPGSDLSAKLSIGRQNWQLNDGFLFSRFAGGANAGPYPALYLNPRTAFEMSVLGTIKWKDLRLEGFYLDPNEIDFLDSNSTYLGTNLSYTPKNQLEASILYYTALDSDTVFATPSGDRPREGLQTYSGRLGSSKAFGVDNLELFGEYAWQTHSDVDWNAHAYYLRTGYTFSNILWTPNLSYRYASFSGDDPTTDSYERFDAPLSSGLDTWVQGVTFKKVVPNGNLNSHRVRLNVVPHEKVALTFDYFLLLADETDGGELYGHEFDVAVRWSINRNLFLLGVAGVAMPGANLEDRAQDDLENWTTLQLSLFWNL